MDDLEKDVRAARREVFKLRRRLFAIGFPLGLALLAVTGALYVGVAFIVAFLAQRYIPYFEGWPVVPSIVALVGVALLVVDTYYLVIRSGKVQKMMVDVHAEVNKWIDPKYLGEDVDLEIVHMIGMGFVRGYLTGFLSGIVLFHSFYAACASWGISELVPGVVVFASVQDAGFWQHLVYWISIPFDLFLLDAPSLFGFNLTDLEPNRSVIAFLVGVFLFKTILVATVFKLIYAAMTFKPEKERLVLGDGASLSEQVAYTRSAPST